MNVPVVALLGRPNSGKSSLYNAITGGDARVGNYPGVTVDILDAVVELPSGARATLTDLPGLYSVDAVVDPETDEGVAAGFIARARASDGGLVIVQVIDGTQLALGLRMTRELIAKKLSLVVCVTQKDILDAEGRSLDAKQLEIALGVPVVLVSARDPSAKAAVLGAVDAAVSRANKKGDENITKKPEFSPNSLAKTVTTLSNDEARARRRTITERADRVLLHPLIGPVLFLSLMAMVFAAVFLIADPATALMDFLVNKARGALTGVLGKGMLGSFVVDGLLGGAGTVLAFMPQIVILTIAMELLEASGYLARGAFLVDRLLRLLGLSGRSFLPLLMGHACAVPAIGATRVVRDPKERLTTILVLPLMTCSARIPTYALVLATFFSQKSALYRACVFVALYFAGVLSGLIASLVLRRTATGGKSLPLVLEMPAYRLPQASAVLRKAQQAGGRFLRDVGTVILAVSAVLWVLLTIPVPGSVANAGAPPIERSIAATIGKAVEPITAPVGFDWRIDVGLIGSLGQRELMVSTMGVIFGIEKAGDDPSPLSLRMREAKRPDGSPVYSTRNGLALLAFFVLACQCTSTLAAIRRETKSWKWPAFVLAYTYAIAYAAAFVVYWAAGLFA